MTRIALPHHPIVPFCALLVKANIYFVGSAATAEGDRKMGSLNQRLGCNIGDQMTSFIEHKREKYAMIKNECIRLI